VGRGVHEVKMDQIVDAQRLQQVKVIKSQVKSRGEGGP
jgi:hypothetical protein